MSKTSTERYPAKFPCLGLLIHSRCNITSGHNVLFHCFKVFHSVYFVHQTPFRYSNQVLHIEVNLVGILKKCLMSFTMPVLNITMPHNVWELQSSAVSVHKMPVKTPHTLFKFGKGHFNQFCFQDSQFQASYPQRMPRPFCALHSLVHTAPDHSSKTIYFNICHFLWWLYITHSKEPPGTHLFCLTSKLTVRSACNNSVPPRCDVTMYHFFRSLLTNQWTILYVTATNKKPLIFTGSSNNSSSRIIVATTTTVRVISMADVVVVVSSRSSTYL
jgi:hypothetical protein